MTINKKYQLSFNSNKIDFDAAKVRDVNCLMCEFITYPQSTIVDLRTNVVSTGNIVIQNNFDIGMKCMFLRIDDVNGKPDIMSSVVEFDIEFK